MSTESGLPEGGLLGPLCYPLLPRMLDKCLAAAGAGVGVDIPSHRQQELAGLCALSPVSAQHSAALDGSASLRMHILLIADDQIIPESSLERLRLDAQLASTWASSTAQEYHVNSPDKTAILLLGRAADVNAYMAQPVELAGVPLPCVTARKWCGIIWDAWLSFVPFLEARVGAARAAYKQLRALAVDRAAPVEELREVMRATVEGTLLYGAMFVFLAPGYYEAFVKLQLEFERGLLQVAPWTSGTLVRSVAGWRLNWGERVMLDVLVFRAELFCCPSDMLVRQVWGHAQHMPGRTFAKASLQLLQELGLPEIHAYQGWEYFLASGISNLASYKSLVLNALEMRSISEWRASLIAKSDCLPHLLAQQCPMSVGQRLLEADYMDHLHETMDFDKMRIGLVPLSRPSTCVCALCHAQRPGLSHVLGECAVVHVARLNFLSVVDVVWSAQLGAAQTGDWPTAVLNPHQPISRLAASVRFVSQIVQLLRRSCEMPAR